MFLKNYLGLLFFYFLIALSSCQEDKPNHFKLLTERDMVEMIGHVHIQEAIAQQQGFSLIDSARVFYYQKMDSILSSKNYSLADLDSSFAYYSQRPELMDMLYQKAIDSLAIKQVKAIF